jgi:pimeloyl-ACP methyl ester carboxylesterase
MFDRLNLPTFDPKCLARWLSSGLVVMLALASVANGQVDPKKKIPPPEELVLRDSDGTPLSKDGVELYATWYPGINGKETVPVIMLHMYKGSRVDYHDLARHLQENYGHAVLVPDLRAHGDSIDVVGSKLKLNVNQLNPAHYERMISDDLEACKKFLMGKNNAGQLNIDKLCMVGAEMGSVIALNWAMRDWHARQLVGLRQGQDVKALVLISPEWTIERSRTNMNLPSQDELLHKNISLYIVHGTKDQRDANRLYDAVERFHTTKGEDQSLFKGAIETPLSGTKMLTVPQLGVDRRIALFIKARVAEKNIPWRDRSGPL